MPPYNPFELQEENGIRTFKDGGLQRAIDSAISRRNPKKDFIVIGHVDNDQLYLSAAYKLGDSFSIVAAAYKKKDVPKGWSVGAEVVWEPF